MGTNMVYKNSSSIQNILYYVSKYAIV